MSTEVILVKQEPCTDSPEPPEEDTEKNIQNNLTIQTEFVHIKEEIDENSYCSERIKTESPDNDDVVQTNTNKNQTTIKVKSETCIDKSVEGVSTEHEAHYSIAAVTLTEIVNDGHNMPKVNNGYLLSGMLEKRFDEGRYANELNNTISNYIVNGTIGNDIFDTMAGVDKLKINSKSKKTRNKIKQKNKMNAILERLYRESLKRNGDEKEENSADKVNFDEKDKIVDIVSTPEVKDESFYNDSDSGASNATFPVLTVREGFPLPEFNVDDRFCPVCHEGFSSPANMQRHFHIHTKNRNYECNICNIKFWRRQELTKHMYRHDVREFECETCKRKFKSKSNLNQHLKCHTVRYPCLICEKTYMTEALYQKHKNRNLCRRKGALLRCQICFKGFKYECSLKCHVRRHSPDRPYICDMCPMDFETKREIENHINYHTRCRPFKCAVCPKRFANVSFRRAHMRVHTGEKPFQCPLCEKFFTHKHNMERHLERHGKEKKLICDICERKFPRESRLVYHMRSHFNKKPFSCEICPKKFAHKQNVVKHYSRKHPGAVYSNAETDASVAYKTWQKIQSNLVSVPEDDSEQILS